MKIIYKYPNFNLIIDKIKKKKEIIQHGSDDLVKIFVIEINNKLYVLKIKDKKYVRWDKDRIHYNKEFINIYKYIINHLNKSLLKYFYKILYTIEKNNKFYHIMEKYDYDLDYDFFHQKYSNATLKNILTKIQILLFNLNNKLHIYHNDIINRNLYHIRNIMYNKKKIKHKKTIKYKLLNDISVKIYNDEIEPIMIDLDNATINTPYIIRLEHFNKVFDNKIHYMSEVIIFTYYYLIMVLNKGIENKKIKLNNRNYLKNNIIKLYNSFKKNKDPTYYDACFIKNINTIYFDMWVNKV